MFVTNWISTTKIQKISEITNFFRHYFLSRTEVKLTLFYQITAFYAKKYKCNKYFLTCINYFRYVMKMTFL